MNDMNVTIIPKSDQMNADDLIAGPRTITIREVKIAPGIEQPVGIYFHGDDGKPYLPCKSMRRVMVYVWGADASVYAGRSMTLYRDPSVTWGGMEVGGIRISHMSHLDRDTQVVLTATKKTRKPFRVSPLVMPKNAPAGKQEAQHAGASGGGGVLEPAPSDPDADMADVFLAEIAECETPLDVRAWARNSDVKDTMARFKTDRPELFARVKEAVDARVS